MKIEQLKKELKSKTPPVVVDVRTSFEFNSGHISGAINLPVYSLLLRGSRLPKAKESLLVVTCEHGPRAVLAKGMLGLLGYKNCALLEGHMMAWKKKGLPLDK